MKQTAAERFERIHALAAEDPEYQRLLRQMAGLDLPFLAVLEKLEPEDRGVILDYIRTLGASALRLTEIACETIK